MCLCQPIFDCLRAFSDDYVGKIRIAIAENSATPLAVLMDMTSHPETVFRLA
jgi:hypothetical protein